MSELDGFLQAIGEEPADETNWLVMSDWLEDNDDPRRAEIYERLNIPTVATTTWGIKQIQLMLFHDRQEVRESLGGGDLVRLRLPVPLHLVGKKVSDVNVDGKILVGGVSRGGGGFIPTADSTFQNGDYLAIIMAKDGMDLLDEIMSPPAGDPH